MPSPSASIEALPIAVPTAGVIVAARPTDRPAAAKPTPATKPTPKPTAHPQPTERPPKPTPTAKPPPKATPPPKPASKPAHPPCPGAVDGPPGHNKGLPGEPPCGKSGDKGKSESKGGVIVVLPLLMTGAAIKDGRRKATALRRRRPSR
ncbi:MAG: hypothetical protein ACJ767_02690 [Chloroflexota bacterium]